MGCNIISVQIYIESYAHWVAFALLTLVGGNMLREALDTTEEEGEKKDATKGMTLILLSVATSIILHDHSVFSALTL